MFNKMMIIAHNSRARKEVKREYGRISGDEEENAGYGGMVQPSQQHAAPCVKLVKWG